MPYGTNLTKNMKNKTISKTFKLAKEELEEAKSICYALPEDEVGDVCRNIIKKRLNGCLMYESWMRNYHHDLYITMWSEDFREGRNLWIDSLIKEFNIPGNYNE